MMTGMYGDTIAAISTPLGEGGIGIVRISGEKAPAIVRAIFTGNLQDHRISHGHIVDPETGQRVDEVLVSYMEKPHTYTREDVVEINCHGGPMPLQQVLRLALRQGARAAQPGEFTLRAFLNGRIDLVQAESVLDIIQARSEASWRLAMSGLEGRLSAPIGKIRATLLAVLASLTVRIDFPEDDVATDDSIRPLNEALETVRALIRSADTGMICRQGIRTAIVGRPNVGKSSLLNRLLRHDRSIVTPLPGTTRDTVEEVASIGGVAFVLIDTAGITESGNVAECLSVERSRKAAEQADLVLLVLDRSEAINEADREIMRLTAERPRLVVANKGDLPLRARIDDISEDVVVTISALSGAGVDQLESRMLDVALGGKVITPDTPLVGNPRHRAALERAEQNLAQAVRDLEQGMADDFITIDLTAAIKALGEITGETVGEELLETIFANFCVGK
jgi:tRNA modification GTPase